MELVTLREILKDVGGRDYAVPAFNILNHLTLKGVLEECEATRSPVIIQTSVATVKFYGVPGLAAMVRAEARLARVPVALHLDHCTDPALARQCVDNGWTSIMIDASHEPFEKNVAVTREIVDYAHAKGVSVEGELGAISGVEDNISVDESAAHMADVGQSREFVLKTGVDAFAPAVGTAHGLYKGEPKIDLERFADIRRNCGDTPLVVHGGTGLSTETFHRFIELGAAKINISTALKQAYLGAVQKYLADSAGKPSPLPMDRHIIDSVRKTAGEHIRLFRSELRV